MSKKFQSCCVVLFWITYTITRMVQVIGGMSHLANNAITCLCHRQFLFTLPSNPHRNKSQYSRRLLPYITRANSPDEEYSSPDWEREMSIFKKRTMKPSQLEALRRFEEKKVDVGRVCFVPHDQRRRQIASTLDVIKGDDHL